MGSKWKSQYNLTRTPQGPRPAYYRARATKAMQLMSQIKLERGCSDCGYKEHAVALDFDHRDPETKIANVSAMRQASKKTLLAEIEKCDVVCANCHRVRTWIGR